jgi:hypothetical protein
MEDPSLPLPRFTPPVRKMRPAPIDVLSGIEKAKARNAFIPCCSLESQVKVPTPSLLSL